MLIDGKIKLTVRELIEELQQKNPAAIVVAHGTPAKEYVSASIYKMESAADDSAVYLYMSSS